MVCGYFFDEYVVSIVACVFVARCVFANLSRAFVRCTTCLLLVVIL